MRMGSGRKLMSIPKYEYFFHVWGGFFNDHNKEIHGYEEGTQYFDDQHTRDLVLQNMEKARVNLDTRDAILVYKIDEGYHVRKLPACHRVVEYKGKRYYSTYKWHWPESADTLWFCMENKWYPGFNDHVVEEELGHEVDYNNVEIVQEWITGAFNYESI